MTTREMEMLEARYGLEVLECPPECNCPSVTPVHEGSYGPTCSVCGGSVSEPEDDADPTWDELPD